MLIKQKSQCYSLLPIVLFVAVFCGNTYAGSLKEGRAMYEKGSYKQAANILMPLAKNNDTEAQNLIGLMCAKGGDSFPVNDKKAVFWFNKAANLGHTRAARNLAFLEANGRGTGAVISDDTADEEDCEDE